MTKNNLTNNILLMIANEKYKDFACRLNELMSKHSVSITNLCNALGITYEMARRYTLGTAKPRDEKMIKIAKHLNTSPAFLDYGVTTEKIETETIEMLDVYASAGKGCINQSYPDTIRSIEISKDKISALFGRKSLDGIKIINADGDSMSPTIAPGDILFVDTKIDSFTGDGIYAFVFEESLYVKRLQKIKGKTLAVISDNNQYLTFNIESHELNEIYIFGRVLKSLPLKLLEFA
ncbi:LexA family transcriptional regulator [Gilliamella sp. B2838]|uniref:LexA family transcriptional regulator n=1 Tax=Gilliamella sp. B2838 TaxID=2818020 RepID=UPI00226AEE73|nr:S24 family peptidase [Gilliamella sp. B2838]MCX8726956.1 hypothetical protein [Gilliamella sp. B2838]